MKKQLGTERIITMRKCEKKKRKTAFECERVGYQTYATNRNQKVEKNQWKVRQLIVSCT